MGPAVALLAVLPSSILFGFAQEVDFELKFEETVIPLARERAGGKRCAHRTLILLRMGAVAEVAAHRQRVNLGKDLLGSFTGNPDVEFSHARRVNDHAALWEENHLAPRSGMPAFGVIRAHFHGGLDVFSIEAVDEARLADNRGADERGGVAGFYQLRQFLHASPGERTGREH